ncbi:hypothetical protein REPUB_Repub15cG0068600 [Reevesia pubescens]
MRVYSWSLSLLLKALVKVPIGGAYRLIDVPMSNCINSGINKVYILTQFISTSLKRHLSHAYNFGNGVDFGDGYVEIMYKPLRDLNGIPGAKSLIICLTGYQRQDRDDIMTMVSLMGAQFSKPLVANKVTHLICYKFEDRTTSDLKSTNLRLKYTINQEGGWNSSLLLYYM